MFMQPTLFVNEVFVIDLVDLVVAEGLVQLLVEHDLLRDHSSNQTVSAFTLFAVLGGEEMRQLTEIV